MASASVFGSIGEPCYAIVQQSDSSEPLSIDVLRKALEKGPDDARIVNMKAIISGLINGETSLSSLLMPVIRYVVPTRSKPLKRLLLLFLEVCPKCSSDGRLLPEMILVCNAIRSDLLHPNEYIRGAALRMVCKLRHAELLEPLMPSCLLCLDHRHAYVRKNAVLAIYSIYNHIKSLIPNAPCLIYDFIIKENDMSCRRDALMALQNIAPELTITFLASVAHLIPTFDENLQLTIIDILRQEARRNSTERKKFINLLISLLQAPDAAVKFEAATSLTSLTSNPVAVRACLQCYIQLLNKTPSNNVKLIVLERVSDLVDSLERHEDDLALDLLRMLSTPDIDVRKNVCQIAIEITTPRNVERVISVLRKELAKASEVDLDSSPVYRQLVIQTIHVCAMRYPFCIASSVNSVLEFLSDTCYSSAVEVAVFVREAMEKYSDLRDNTVDRLTMVLSALKSGKVMRGVLWILGEHTIPENSLKVLIAIKSALGDVVLNDQEFNGNIRQPVSPLPMTPLTASSVIPLLPVEIGRNKNAKILPDGSYASESAFSANINTNAASDRLRKPPLQALLQNSDYFTATVLSTCLTKISLRLHESAEKKIIPFEHSNSFIAESISIMANLLQQGLTHNMDEDSCLRIQQCIGILCSKNEEDIQEISGVYLNECRKVFAHQILSAEKDGYNNEMTAFSFNKKKKMLAAQKAAAKYKIDEPIQFRQLIKSCESNDDEICEEHGNEIDRAAIGVNGVNGEENKLKRIMQLTGFSDDVYAEAYVNVNRFDVILDVLIVNQTAMVLQNMMVEFATLGDLKLIERPAQITLAPNSYHTMKINIKVASTETGVIFGNIVYDIGALDTRCVILNDIYIDIMDYIIPAQCTETRFRSMWVEFEWENKIYVNSARSSMQEFLEQVQKCTNMACLTPVGLTSVEVQCGVLSANLYARSVFGEDALANICIEKLMPEDPITGHIRIRSKTQGIALSLGDKISLGQKKFIAGINNIGIVH